MPLPAVVNGTFNGTTFHPMTAFSANAMGSSSSFGFIFISDKANFCQLLSQSTPAQPANAAFLLMLVGVSDGSNTALPTMPGMYPLQNGAGMTGNVTTEFKFIQTDGSCMTVMASSETAATGNVQLTSVANGVYAGSFDAMMMQSGGGMDHVTGEFHAQACPGLAAAFNTNPTCM